MQCRLPEIMPHFPTPKAPLPQRSLLVGAMSSLPGTGTVTASPPENKVGQEFRHLTGPIARQMLPAASIIMKKTLFITMLAITSLASGANGAENHSWPGVFDPFQVVTLNFQVDPVVWEAIKRDTNFYDPVLNIREPVLMWADGEEPLLVEMRRKSDPALPSEDNPEKVSLKIDINEYVDGQEWRGLRKLSLENGAGGNGVLREGVSMHLHRLAAGQGFYDWSAGYCSWVRVVVNGQYVGLYASPEQRDKQFLRNRGLYKPGSVWLYEVNGGTTLDETVATTHSPTYDFLNFSPFRGSANPPANLEAALEPWIDMRGMLTMAAIEAFVGNSDGLFTKDGKNSFAVDFLPSDQYRRCYLPWDLDNGMTNLSHDIYSGGPGPQRNRPYQVHILGNDWYRLQYRHIMNDLLDGPLSPAVLNGFISELEAAIGPAFAEDPNNMMGGASPAAAASGFQALRQWVIDRGSNVRGQVGALPAPPVFSRGGGAASVGETITLSHSNAGGAIHFTTDGSDPRALGGSPAGSAYSGPITLAGTRHIRARVLVNGVWSALREATFTVPGHASALKITEIMYRPTRDPDAVDAEVEFLEIKNTGTTTVDLSGLWFANGIDYRFPVGASLAPGAFFVIAENAEHFRKRHGFPPGRVYRRQLANEGETLTIRDALGLIVFRVTYQPGAPWPVLANGHGFSLVPVSADANPEPDNPANWRASSTAGGSPAADDATPVFAPVLVNEALTHTDLPLRDQIELHNPNPQAVDVSGWFLTDKRSEPTRWRIPDESVIEAGGFLVFEECDELGNIGPEHFGAAFGLSSLGEEVHLIAADAAGNLTGYSHGFVFGAAENGVSFGRHLTASGVEHFVRQKERTFGAVNAGPAVGPLVITELMYHPSGTNDEFIELMNLGTAPLPLHDPAHPQNTWRIGGVDFNFPQAVTLAPREIILVVPVSPATFRQRYAIDPAIRIFGPYPGALSNGGELIRLRMPDRPNTTNGVTTVPYIDIDAVNYGDRAPWPVEPDGFGPSLERIDPAGFADDPLNWHASEAPGGTPGSVTFPGSFASPFDDWLALWDLTGPDADPLADPDGDGIVNLLEYALALDPTLAVAGAVPGTEGLPASDQPDPDTFSLIYRRNLTATDLEYVVEFSPDLDSSNGLGWFPGVVGESIVSETGDIQVIRATLDSTGMNAGFLRLRVKRLSGQTTGL